MNQFVTMIRPSSRHRLRRLIPIVAKPVTPGSVVRRLGAKLTCGHVPAWPVYLLIGAATWLLVGLFVSAAALGYVWMIHRIGRQALRRAAATKAAGMCGIAFAGIADELRAGRGAEAALFTGVHHIETVVSSGSCAECAGRGAREWRRVRHAIPGGEAAVVTALRSVSAPFDGWACQLAAAWSLTGSGVALGDVLDSLERELESTRESERARAVHTAAARATVAVLTGLPAIGLVLGSVMGANPVRLLLDTPLGSCCLLTATALQLVGWWWADRIANGSRDRVVAGAELGAPRKSHWGWLVPRGERISRSRLRSVSPSDHARPSRGREVSDRRRFQFVVRWGAAGLSGAAAAWFAGTALALPVGALLTLAVGFGLSRSDRSSQLNPLWETQFPYALSLTAALLRSGATTPHAVSTVGVALPGPVGSVFLATGAAMRRGRSARSAWPDRYADTPVGGSLLRALDRTSHSGAGLAGVCERLAGQLRRDTAANSAVKAQRAGVVMVAPLMCCFLPAFVLLGVVPVVADVLYQALGRD